MTDKLGARPADQALAVPATPASAVDGPSGFDPSREEWHLVCVTRKGKVTMLKNLDLRTARETYKRLLPGTHPEDHQYCELCEKEAGGFSYGFSTWSSCLSSSDTDYLERIEALGPDGVSLDPWHGVEPRIVFHCSAGEPYYSEQGKVKFRPPHPRPEPKWDERRTDFWNNPKLWATINPAERKCWMPEDVQ